MLRRASVPEASAHQAKPAGATKRDNKAPAAEQLEDYGTKATPAPTERKKHRKRGSFWEDDLNVNGISRYRHSKKVAWQSFMKVIPDAPPVPYDATRGIVLCGGGKVYFSSALAVIRVLRHHGCKLPIELWIGAGEEMPAAMEKELEEEDVVVRSAASTLAMLADPGVGKRSQNKQFPLKAVALVLSRFSQVLLLDADNFPVKVKPVP